MKDKVKSDGLVISSLPHTWLFDIDGTIVKHNGYKTSGKDVLLPGVKKFFNELPQHDMIILLTARKEKYRVQTEKFLQNNGIHYDMLIMELPAGERILVNDDKPSGISMGYAVCKERDAALHVSYIIDDDI